jgi:hypothetical protein
MKAEHSIIVYNKSFSCTYSSLLNKFKNAPSVGLWSDMYLQSQ